MANDYYPPGTFELPGDRDEEKVYVFEIHGEVEVTGYSEQDAETHFRENLGEILSDAFKDGKIEVV